MGYLKKEDYIAKYGEEAWLVFNEKEKQRAREWYQKNKDRKNQKKREWRAANMEKHLEYQKEYSKKWRETNHEHWLVWQKENTKTMKGRASRLYNNYKSDDRIKGREGNNLTTQWILENIIKSSCVYCGESDFTKLGCDRIDNTKAHTMENVVCSCWDCNNTRQKLCKSVEEFKEYKRKKVS